MIKFSYRTVVMALFGISRTLHQIRQYASNQLLFSKQIIILLKKQLYIKKALVHQISQYSPNKQFFIKYATKACMHALILCFCSCVPLMNKGPILLRPACTSGRIVVVTGVPEQARAKNQGSNKILELVYNNRCHKLGVQYFWGVSI